MFHFFQMLHFGALSVAKMFCFSYYNSIICTNSFRDLFVLLDHETKRELTTISQFQFVILYASSSMLHLTITVKLIKQPKTKLYLSSERLFLHYSCSLCRGLSQLAPTTLRVSVGGTPAFKNIPGEPSREHFETRLVLVI